MTLEQTLKHPTTSRTAARRPRVDFLSIPVDALTMAETLHHIETIIKSRQMTHHFGLNVSKFTELYYDQHMATYLTDNDWIHADGMGIYWGARLLGLPLPERVAGIDLMENAIAMAAQKGYRVYFLGAQPDVVHRIVDVYRERYPTLQVAGFEDGYFSDDAAREIALNIRNSRADMLFVGMSSPKKEAFIHRFLDVMQVPYVLGVGGSFDVIAGKIKRAPHWVQVIGCEWIYRLMQEPRRLWKRYLVTNLQFAGILLRSLTLGHPQQPKPDV